MIPLNIEKSHCKLGHLSDEAETVKPSTTLELGATEPILVSTFKTLSHLLYSLKRAPASHLPVPGDQMQRSALQPPSCVCSTSYPATTLRDRCSGRDTRTHGTLHHESSCWGSSSTAAFARGSARSSRRRTVARGLVIEARRFRPDPIVPPFIIEERGGGQEVTNTSRETDLVSPGHTLPSRVAQWAYLECDFALTLHNCTRIAALILLQGARWPPFKPANPSRSFARLYC